MSLVAFTSMLADFGTGYLIFTLFVAAYFYRNLDRLRKFLAYYLVLMACTDVACTIVGRTYGTNHIVLPVYCFTELGFFLYLFKKHLFNKKHPVTAFIGIAGLAYILCEFFFNFIYHHISPDQYQPYVKVIDNFVIIIFSLTYLLEKMTTYNESRWSNFSLNMGLLIYFTLSTIFFLPFNFMVNEKSEFKFYFWLFNLVLTYSFYTFLVIEMYRNAHINRGLVRKGSFVNN